jgi:hypothetical protein
MIEITSAHARSRVTPEQFFARWIDHATWPDWSPDTEWVHLDAPPALGVSGELKPKGGPKTRFEISAFQPGREYTDTSFFPGARLVFQHLAARSGTETELVVRVTLSGPLARLWAGILGKGFRESAQADLDRLVTLVEAS